MNMSFPALVADIQQNKPELVSSMVERINSALLERAKFERQNKPNGSHIEFRRVANQFNDSRTVAAFLIALNASPEIMFNRERKAGTRADLKGLQKVRKLIDYVTGRTTVIDTVTKALFAATIIAAKMGIEWIASPEQEMILSDSRIKSLPNDVREAIADYQLRHMSLEGDSRPQSCRFRTTFANLGLYQFHRDEFDNSDSTLGISVNLDNPLIQYLTLRWDLNSFKGG